MALVLYTYYCRRLLRYVRTVNLLCISVLVPSVQYLYRHMIEELWTLIKAFMVMSDEDTEVCRGMLASHNHDGVVVRGGEHLMNIAANSLLYSLETMTTIFYAIHLYLTIPYFN